jgi:hypothetical protein
MGFQPHRSVRFTPRLETLGPRWCPSVTVQANGPELRIEGNDAADAVVITDNGQGGVTVTADGRTRTFNGISQIRVDTRGGNDTVDYRLTGSTTAQSRVRIDLGGGADTATVRAAGVRLGAEAEVEVNGVGGADTITADYAVEVDSRFRLRLDGGSGNDTVTANLALAAGSTGAVEALAKGNDGDDRLTLNVTGATGSLDAKIDGDAGFDRCAGTPNVRVEECEAPL